MLFLALIGGMLVGAGLYAKFGNLFGVVRARHYKHKFLKMVQANDALDATNKQLLQHIEYLESGERDEYMTNVNRGIADATRDMALGGQDASN